MNIMRILFAFMAFILFCEMFVGESGDIRRNCTFGYIATIVGIIALYAIG